MTERTEGRGDHAAESRFVGNCRNRSEAICKKANEMREIAPTNSDTERAKMVSQRAANVVAMMLTEPLKPLVYMAFVMVLEEVPFTVS